MSEDLSGKTVIVTGSSSGIGKRLARAFGAEGATVITNARLLDRARHTADEIRDAGGTAVPVEADVSDRGAAERLVERAVEETGSLDVMVNNAGLSPRFESATELSPEDWQAVLDVNLTGVFFGSQAAGEQLIRQGTGGQIVNVSSIWGQQGAAGRVAYCTTKAGVENLTRSLAVEWADHGVYVNALAPGYVETESVVEEVDECQIANRTPLGRYATFEEIANCVLFLAGGNHFVTGEVLTADGGWTAFGWGSAGD